MAMSVAIYMVICGYRQKLDCGFFFSETLHLLLDSGKGSMTRLEFKQRLAIAIGAAKGSTTMRRRLFFSVMNLENSKYNCSLTCRSESSA